MCVCAINVDVDGLKWGLAGLVVYVALRVWGHEWLGWMGEGEQY